MSGEDTMPRDGVVLPTKEGKILLNCVGLIDVLDKSKITPVVCEFLLATADIILLILVVVGV